MKESTLKTPKIKLQWLPGRNVIHSIFLGLEIESLRSVAATWTANLGERRGMTESVQLAGREVAVSSPQLLGCVVLMDEPLFTSSRCWAPPAAHLSQAGPALHWPLWQHFHHPWINIK